MVNKHELPWASGPAEILKHGVKLLEEDTDTNRRLAMISIDNAVELMIKTYLGLPERITGFKIPRKEYQEFSESFPKLLDALEKYGADKIAGIDLGFIEFYHRIRNQLYHGGIGLTVERDKVEVYAEIANVLFDSLFGILILEPKEDATALLGEFLREWVSLEKVIDRALNYLKVDLAVKLTMPIDAFTLLHQEGLLSISEMADITLLRSVRNEVMHSNKDYKELVSRELIEEVINIRNILINKLKEVE